MHAWAHTQSRRLFGTVSPAGTFAIRRCFLRSQATPMSEPLLGDPGRSGEGEGAGGGATEAVKLSPGREVQRGGLPSPPPGSAVVTLGVAVGLGPAGINNSMNRAHESGSPGGGLETHTTARLRLGRPSATATLGSSLSRVLCPPSPNLGRASRPAPAAPPPAPLPSPSGPAAPPPHPLEPSSNPVPRSPLAPPPASRTCRPIGRRAV